MWRLATGTPMLSAICCWLIVIVYFAAGPHPRRLCLRGLRRSALRRSTFRFHNTPSRTHVDDSRLRARSGSRLPPPVPSRLTPLGIASIDSQLNPELLGIPLQAELARRRHVADERRRGDDGRAREISFA